MNHEHFFAQVVLALGFPSPLRNAAYSIFALTDLTASGLSGRNLVKCFRTTDILSFFRLVCIIHLDCGWLTVIIWLLCFLLLVRALSTASISPAILQPAVFPRSPDQVIIAAAATAAAEVRPPPAHVIAASPPLLPTSPPAGTLLKLIREILL